MENKSNRNFNNRPKASGGASYGRDKKSYGNRDSKPYANKDNKSFDRTKSNYQGDKPSYSKDRKPYGDRENKHFDRPKSNYQGDKPSYSKDRKPYGDRENKPFDRPKSNYQGDKPNYSKDRKPYGDRENKPFDRPKPNYQGDKPSYSKDRKPYGDRENKPFDRPRSNYQGDKPNYSKDRKPYGDRENKPFDKPRSNYQGDKPSYNKDRKPYGDRENKPFDRPKSNYQGDKPSYNKDRKPYGDRENKPFDRPKSNYQGDKPSYSKDRKPYGDRENKPFIKREFDQKQDKKDDGGLLSRLSAFRIIQDITIRKAYTSLALNNVLKSSTLSDTDKRLVTNTVYTTIENLIKLDYIIDSYMETPTEEPVLRDVLRLSAAQILFFDRVPDFAIINVAVNLIRLVSTVEQWSGLVNGVLRNIARNKDSFEWPQIEDDLEKHLSIMHSMPISMVQRLIKTFGETEAIEIISYKKENKATCIRPNLMHTSKEKFEKMLSSKGWKFELGLVNNSYLVQGIENIAEDEDFKKGDFSIQGQSSMLAVEAVENSAGMYVLDACAAPGGKSLYLAEKQNGTGRVYAWDIHPHRVELIREQMYRTNPGNIRVANCDASVYRDDLNNFFNAVLIDAPCSNLGMISEKPDVKYNMIEEDFDSLVELQYKILNNCAKYVRPGGVLVYSTCSILPEENEKQIMKFLQNNPNFKIQKLPNCIPQSIKNHEGEYGLQIFSHKSSLEGFYIVKLVKDNYSE